MAKSELPGITVTQEGSEKDQKEGERNCVVADFVKALQQWYECFKKCVVIGSGPVKKHLEVNSS